jgi:hypothetical protein
MQLTGLKSGELRAIAAASLTADAMLTTRLFTPLQGLAGCSAGPASPIVIYGELLLVQVSTWRDAAPAVIGT